MSYTGLDRDLLAEFESESRRIYAELLAALSRATHPDPGSGPPADAWAAVARLCECWLAARAMAAPPTAVRDRFPLTGSGTVRLLDTLLTLAAYSGSAPDRVERVGSVLRQLGQAVDSSGYHVMPTG
jgi:hypothetical protein